MSGEKDLVITFFIAIESKFIDFKNKSASDVIQQSLRETMMIRCLQVSLWALLWWGLSTCPSAVDAKKDRNKPQGHHGYLTPYKAGPFSTVLSKNDEKLLASGKPVMKQTMPSKDDPEAGGGALCVQDVDAPVAAVWNQILDLGSYKGKVPKIVASSNYVNKRNPDGTNNIKTRLVIGVMPGYAVRFVICLVSSFVLLFHC